ncbi:MAG TPA: PAS domain-containing protein, partial [Burkholderiales bacterium]|nr:PAS domain-containing protein [Burkholderiales bacterium]
MHALDRHRTSNDAREPRVDDDAPVMTWAARPDLSCESVNRAWLEFTGYNREQALGEGWSRTLHPEDLARWLDACVRAFDARQPFEIEYRLRRRDGEYRWILERCAPRVSGDGVFL